MRLNLPTTLKHMSCRVSPPFAPTHLAQHPPGTTGLNWPRQTAYSDAVDFLPELRHGAAAAKGSRSRMEDRHRVETLPHVRTVSDDDSTAPGDPAAEGAAVKPEDVLPDPQRQQQQQQQQQQPQPAFYAVGDEPSYIRLLCMGDQADQAQPGPLFMDRQPMYSCAGAFHEMLPAREASPRFHVQAHAHFSPPADLLDDAHRCLTATTGCTQPSSPATTCWSTSSPTRATRRSCGARWCVLTPLPHIQLRCAWRHGPARRARTRELSVSRRRLLLQSVLAISCARAASRVHLGSAQPTRPQPQRHILHFHASASGVRSYTHLGSLSCVTGSSRCAHSYGVCQTSTLRSLLQGSNISSNESGPLSQLNFKSNIKFPSLPR